MVSQDQSEWPEHAVCARCAAPLNENYRVSPLGVRFCSDCFDKTIQEKVRERTAKIYLQGHCSNCGRSLINGYRLTKLGVLYCISCYESITKSSKEKTGEQTATDTAANKVVRSKSEMAAEGILWTSLASSHLFFFINLLFLSNYTWHIAHPDSYFKGLICLDFLTLLVLLTSRRAPASRLGILWTLLIAIGFIILIGRDIIGFLS